jgi:two-component system, chemotaxis family, CheB/CheR fusion protein
MAGTAMASDERCDPRQRVLIVDDCRHCARMLMLLLRLQGYEVSAAHDGIEALALAKALQPSIILMDLTLPRMSGVEVAEELRKSDGFAQTVIVAISGYGADQIPQPSPFDGHLTKPVELDRLLRLMADRPRGEATPP